MNKLNKMKLNTLSLMKGCFFTLSILVANVYVATASADTLPMPLSENVSESADTPRQGVDMVRVEAKYGQPIQKVDAVGEPPITRWVYPSFTVFFEHDKVLHSVVHRS